MSHARGSRIGKSTDLLKETAWNRTRGWKRIPRPRPQTPRSPAAAPLTPARPADGTCVYWGKVPVTVTSPGHDHEFPKGRGYVLFISGSLSVLHIEKVKDKEAIRMVQERHDGSL